MHIKQPHRHFLHRHRLSPKLRAAFARLVVAATIIAVSVTPTIVFALEKDKLQFFSKNNIIYYDPTNNCTDITSSKPSGAQITWIGDSYTVGAESIIKNKIPGVDIHAQGSKHFAMEVDGNESGLTILKNLDNIREYVVFALGTNDQSGLNDGIDQLEEIVGSNRTVILVTPRTYNYSYEKVISEMRAGAQKYSNIIIADWESAALPKLDEYFSPSIDKIHPNQTGYQAWVDVIYGALPGGVSFLPGNTLEEKVWNYFAAAGIAGVSDNGAVIAGIMGNLNQESGFNPFSHTSGSQYYGIYQTNAAPMLEAIRNAGLDKYWGSSSAPEDAQMKALQIELDFLTQQNERFVGTGWAASFGFKNHLSTPSANTPEAYAELFEVAVEGAVTSHAVSPHTRTSNLLQDPNVLALAVANFSGNAGGGRYYQEVTERRNYARTYYDKYVNSSNTAASTSSSNANNSQQTTSGTGIQWTNDGWLVADTLPGAIIQDATTSGVSLGEVPRQKYTTSDGKPNKILLHSTEGRQNGINAYPANNMFPAHFTIDLKKKTISQHFSIWKPSIAIAHADTYGPIQIEIVGFSTKASTGFTDEYYLQNYSAEEWDYLALVLTAISEQTDIPLTSTVNWANPTRLTDSAFMNYSGVIGHSHVPANDHTDPGDIWHFIEDALSRNPSASKFTKPNSASSCSTTEGGGLVSGGMTLEQASELMKEFYDLAVEYSGTKRMSGQTLTHTFKDGGTVRLYHSGCAESDLANCSTFSQYFVNRFTSADITAWNGGVFVDNLLKLNAGFKDCGTTPHVYAVFSTAGSSSYGHTGVILGIDEQRGKIIIGEAGCGAGLSFIGAKEKDLDKFSSGAYHYACTDDIIKGSLK